MAAGMPNPEYDRILRAAHKYIEHGWPIFPLNGKIPAIAKADGGNGLNDATLDLAQINTWFTRRYTNIGLAIPDGYKALDIDVQHGGDHTFRQWCDEHGADWLDNIPRQRTGNGGLHLIFKDNHDLAYITPNAPGCEMRRKGHYLAVSPSIHPDTHVAYRWELKLPHINDVQLGMPDWLATIFAPIVAPKPIATVTYIAGADPIDNAARQYTSWAQLLTRHGWTLLPNTGDGDSDGSIWRHPTATARSSASIRHGCLFVYSPTPGLPTTAVGSPNGITMFNAIKHLDFAGNKDQTFSALRDGGYLPQHDIDTTDFDQWKRTLLAPQDAAEEDDGLPLTGFRVKWDDLWAADLDDAHFWLIEPILARGRAHALYAKAKDGKSLFMLEAVAAAATGRPFLDHDSSEPITVLYCDYEMTEGDLRSRLESFGYGPEDDLSHLHYLMMPAMMALDTRSAGTLVRDHAAAIGAQLVVIDTTGRATVGPEDEADTIRNFYRYTGSLLKREGITWIRIDHEGKKETAGQRGTSAKNDDVDVVWKLRAKAAVDIAGVERTPLDLTATYARMAEIPKTIDLERIKDAAGTRHRQINLEALPGVKEINDLLDKYGADNKITNKDALALLREHGQGKRTDVVKNALKWRKRRPGNAPGNDNPETPPKSGAETSAETYETDVF